MKKKQPASKRPGEYNASFLRQPDQDRYLALRRKTSPSKEEQAEQLTLLRKAEENRRCVSRYELAQPHIDRAAAELRHDPNNLVVQRKLLRTIVATCYPDFFQVLVELVAKGEHEPPSCTAARQGLEGVLYVMDNTPVGEVIDDLDRRLRFLTNLDAMLEPFRKLKAGDPLDLDAAFEFRATGRGKRTQDRLDRTLDDWGIQCFDLRLLYLAGVKITPAENRVAAVHKTTEDALRNAYKTWSQHLVRKEVLCRGDDRAREILARPKFQALLATAYPALAAAPRPHRSA